MSEPIPEPCERSARSASRAHSSMPSPSSWPCREAGAGRAEDQRSRRAEAHLGDQNPGARTPRRSEAGDEEGGYTVRTPKPMRSLLKATLRRQRGSEPAQRTGPSCWRRRRAQPCRRPRWRTASPTCKVSDLQVSQHAHPGSAGHEVLAPPEALDGPDARDLRA